MKLIQTLGDIEELKAENTLPFPFIQMIEKGFYKWFKAEDVGEPITAFRLPHESCIYYLEHLIDEDFLLRQLIDIEYVETEQLDGIMYFRIGVLHDQEKNVIYFLEGTLGTRLEQWLSN